MVTVSFAETVKAIGIPCDVVPIHSPTLETDVGVNGDGIPANGKVLHALASETHAAVADNHAVLAARDVPTTFGALTFSVGMKIGPLGSCAGRY